MKLILAIDIGTTYIKTALIDSNGNIAGDVHQEPNQLKTDHSGKAVHDPHALRDSLLNSISVTVGNNGPRIAGIGLSKYQFGMLLLDRNHTPLTEISTFADSTAQGNLENFMQAVDPASMYYQTGCPPLAQYPVNRLHHIAQNQPELASKVRHIWGVDAYAMHILTGQAVSDFSTANSMGALNITGEWNPEIMMKVGFNAEYLPLVVDGLSHLAALKPELAGRFGLKRNLPVSVGVYDGAALAAAFTGFAPGIAVGNLGTSGMLRVPAESPVLDRLDSRLLQSCLIRPANQDHKALFLNGAGISNGTIVLRHFLDKIGKDIPFLWQELSTIGANGLFTFPYLGPERDALGAIASGVTIGASISTTKEDEARSLQEGLAMSFLNILRNLMPTHQMIDVAGEHVPPQQNAISKLCLGGGGSRNQFLLRILADTLNLNIISAPLASENDYRLMQGGKEFNLKEMGVIGAAAVFRKCMDPEFDLIANAHNITRGERSIEPIPDNVRRYVGFSECYFNIREKLRPIFELTMSNRGRNLARNVQPVVEKLSAGDGRDANSRPRSHLTP